MFVHVTDRKASEQVNMVSWCTGGSSNSLSGRQPYHCSLTQMTPGLSVGCNMSWLCKQRPRGCNINVIHKHTWHSAVCIDKLLCAESVRVPCSCQLRTTPGLKRLQPGVDTVFKRSYDWSLEREWRNLQTTKRVQSGLISVFTARRAASASCRQSPDRNYFRTENNLGAVQ